MPLVAHRPKGMGALAGLDELDKLRLAGAQVIDLDAVAAGQADQQELVIWRTKHIGRQGAGFASPFEGLGGQVNGHQLVAVLHGGIDRGAFAVNPEVAGRFAGGQPLGQSERAAVPAVDIHMVEPVGSGHKPLHVRRKAQLVGVEYALQGALNFGCAGVDKGQRIGGGVRHNHRLFIRRQVQVVRLFAGGYALGLLPAQRVQHADARRQGIEHKNRCRIRRQKQARKAKQGQPQHLGGAAPRQAWVPAQALTAGPVRGNRLQGVTKRHGRASGRGKCQCSAATVKAAAGPAQRD